jgi:hypothetical protein
MQAAVSASASAASAVDTIIDNTCVAYHALEANLVALRACFPRRHADATTAVKSITPREAVVAVHQLRPAPIFRELLLFAKTKAQTHDEHDDILLTGLRNVFMVMIGQLAIDVAFVAADSCDFTWLHVLAAVSNLMDNATMRLEDAFSTMKLSGSYASDGKAMMEALAEDVTDCMMHAYMVFATGTFAPDSVSWTPLDSDVPFDVRFEPLFILDTRTVHVLKASCHLHHVVLAVKQLEDLNLVSGFDD